MKYAHQYRVSLRWKYSHKNSMNYGPKGRIGPFHHGIDYRTPLNTPVLIAGKIVAYTGNTGLSTNPHLHVDKATRYPRPGKDFSIYRDPSDWTKIEGTVVSARNNGSAGNELVIKATNGYYYRFLHLSKFNVKKGDKIVKEEEVANKSEVEKLYQLIFHRKPDSGGLKFYTGKTITYILDSFTKSDEFKKHESRMAKASHLLATIKEKNDDITKLQVANETLKTKLNEAQGATQKATEQLTATREILSEREKLVDKLRIELDKCKELNKEPSLSLAVRIVVETIKRIVRK